MKSSVLILKLSKVVVVTVRGELYPRRCKLLLFLDALTLRFVTCATSVGVISQS